MTPALFGRRLRPLPRLLSLALLAFTTPVATAAQERATLDLTTEEQAWLDANPVIRIGPDPSGPPLEYFDDEGQYVGIAADYAALLERLLGVRFEVQRRATMNEVVESTLRDEIDVWMAAVQTDARDDYLLFTDPYVEFRAVIIVRDETREQLALEDLAGRRVVGTEGYASIEWLRQNVPGIDITPVPNTVEGLLAVSFGSGDVIVASNALASHYIEELGLTNLRVAGQLDYVWQLSIASRRDWPLLASILQKAVDSIDPEEKRAIYRRWVTLGGEPDSPFSGPVPLGLLGGLLLVAITVFFRWRYAHRGSEGSVETLARRSQWPVYAAALTVIVAILTLVSWAGRLVSERMRQDVGDALVTVLNTTSKAVYHWFREREEEALVWAQNPDVLGSCEELSALSRTVGDLSSSPAQDRLRRSLQPLVEGRGYLGYLLFTPEGLVLGSEIDERVGARGNDPRMREVLRRVLRDPRSVALGLPRREDDGAGVEVVPGVSMVVAAAVRGPNDDSACVLALLLDPEADFTEILQRGRMGESGESYAFNREGRLLSQSRFDVNLRRIGLIAADERGILNVEIRDPGGSLVEGYRPRLSREDQPLTVMARSATSGRSAVDLDGYNDYRGVPVIGAWTWDEVRGFGMATEVDVSQAYQSLAWVRGLLVAGSGMSVILVVMLTGTFAVASRKREGVETKLRRSEERLSFALEGSSDGLWDWNPTTGEIYFSPRWQTMLGYEPGEIAPDIGAWERLVDPDALPAVERAMDEHIVGRAPFYEAEYQVRSKGGEWVWILARGKVVARDKDGSPIRFVGTHTDITDRKEMEAELEVARLRMEDELNVGREIQLSMLPLTFPPYPRRHDFEIYATLEAAREVGGDFYDFFLIDDDHLCFCIGDVSGKGVPAALFMAVTKTLIQSRASNDYSPASILTHVNNEISRNNEASMFVTLFLGILELNRGELRYANAGHNPPYVKCGDGRLIRLDERHGPVIGAVEELVYGDDTITLAQGDQIIVYTDGVTESMNPSEDLYSEERLVNLISGHFDSTRSLVQAIVDDVWVWEADDNLTDDVTVLAVEFQGQRGGEVRDEFELTISNRLEEIARVTTTFEDFAAKHNLPDRARRQTLLMFDELINNVISHAYDDGAAHDIGVRVELTGDRLAITMVDDGVPFNPLVTLPPDLALPIEERKLGGLGLHLVRNTMDEFTYNRRTDSNVVVLVKYLEPTREA